MHGDVALTTKLKVMLECQISFLQNGNPLSKQLNDLVPNMFTKGNGNNVQLAKYQI